MVLSASFSVDVKLADNNIYINEALYDSVNIVNSPEISYNQASLKSTNKSVTDAEVLEIVRKIQNHESCYILETQSAKSISKK